MKIGCPDDWYAALRESYLSIISHKLSLNPHTFHYCLLPRFQYLCPMLMFCRFFSTLTILCHTVTCVLCELEA
jgi:hypothetical protein